MILANNSIFGRRKVYTLKITFDNISNANALVGNSSSLSNWNTFFNLPTYGNPFVKVSVNGNEVSLIGVTGVIFLTIFVWQITNNI